ncbi:MAG: SDR family NAD(P)-dependent oxidoreductase [Oscillospiraceae bacterium]|nr:SDR family NAD(P)-dependent oxidoreductase [Oscillospiraceae bacterium]
MSNIAVITGAAGGIGVEFLKLMLKEKGIDEVWVVGRTESKLQKLRDEFGDKVVPVKVDITNDDEVNNYAKLLEEKNARVKWLINCAGTRALYKKGADLTRLLATIRTNCVGNMAMCYASIPFIGKGDHILNVSSAASFQPLPSNNSYAASKVALRFFSKGLEYELKTRGIKVTCSCPGWVATELMEFADDEFPPIGRLPGVTTPENVAKKSIRDARRGKSICFPTFKVHRDYYLTKYLPNVCVMWYASHIETDRYKDFIKTGIIT